MENQIPLELQYSSIRPKGWYSKFKEWPIEPLSSNMYWNPNEILRFQLQLTNGLLDPYRSHVELKVSTLPAEQFPVGGIQIDSSAQSLISQMVISSNNVEIERITEYDTLAAYLTDIGFSDIICSRREWEGLGYNNYQEGLTRNECTTSGSLCIGPNVGANLVPTFENILPGLTNPLRAAFPSMSYYQQGSSANSWNNTVSQAQLTASNVGLTNYLSKNVIVGTPEQPTTTALNHQGRFMNIRSEYKPENITDYVDTPSSPLTFCPALETGVIPSNFNNGATMPLGKQYLINYDNGIDVHNGNFWQRLPPYPEYFGYKVPVNPRFAIGCNEPMLSPTIPQARFGYGKVMEKPLPIPVRTFKIPLISSVMGVLIPADQFLLIPLKTLYNLLIELTLNPYAMFSTGCCDVHEFDEVGIAKQIPRSFRVTEVQYNLHIYEWPEQEMQQYINESITKEIIITSCSWMLSAQYQIANGQGVRSSWPISTASESLSEVVVLFLSNEYLKYNFCRKQFRLSNNVRSMQLKFNTDYFPPQPLIGNAGNPVQLDSSEDNSVFMEQLLISNNYMFVTNIPQPRINSYNFAINGRCYDVTQNTSYFDKNMFNNGNYSWSLNSVNGDTAMGLPHFHENRYVGRAAFVYSFEPYGHSKNQMTGIDARTARPFDIIFDTYNTNSFPTDQTLYCFTRANVVVIYGETGIKVIGR